MNSWELSKQKINKIVEQSSKLNLKTKAAEEAVKLTLDAVAEGMLTEVFNKAIIEQAGRLVKDAQEVEFFLKQSKVQIERMEKLLSNVANIKDVELDETGKNALCLFSSLLDAAARKVGELDTRTSVEMLKAASYVTWAYLGGSDKAPSVPIESAE